KAARTFDAPEYVERAATAADFLLATMRTDDGRLLHRYRGGDAAIPGLLDDYAFLVWGLVELYEATHAPQRLRDALALHETMLRHFEDAEHGGLFLSPDDGEALFVRQKEFHDGATPSGNAVAALNGLRLARLTGRTELEDAAERIGRAVGEGARQHPIAHTMLMHAVRSEERRVGKQ